MLFCLYLGRIRNSLVVYPQKNKLGKIQADFPVIFIIFDLECHGQTYLKVVSHVFLSLYKIEKPPPRKQKYWSPQTLGIFAFAWKAKSFVIASFLLLFSDTFRNNEESRAKKYLTDHCTANNTIQLLVAIKGIFFWSILFLNKSQQRGIP